MVVDAPHIRLEDFKDLWVLAQVCIDWGLRVWKNLTLSHFLVCKNLTVPVISSLPCMHDVELHDGWIFYVLMCDTSILMILPTLTFALHRDATMKPM